MCPVGVEVSDLGQSRSFQNERRINYGASNVSNNRATSPIPFAPRNKPFLHSSKPARFTAQTALVESLESEKVPPAGEDRGRFRSLLQRIKQKDRKIAGIIRQKAELLGTAVHDLRLPVATIQIYSELLAEGIDGKASPEQAEWIDSIRSVSTFALRLLDETLDLARGESGTLQLHPKPAILADVVAESVAMCRPLAARKRMKLTFVEDGERRRVLVDPLKMSKVFNNLIENAIKFCKPGSRIKVRVMQQEHMVRVSVHDDGPGIDPTDLKNLFTPFQRTRARAYSDEPSAGLGLVIAKHIVDLHDGRIGVKSEVGAGTTFYVSLPA